MNRLSLLTKPVEIMTLVAKATINDEAVPKLDADGTNLLAKNAVGTYLHVVNCDHRSQVVLAPEYLSDSAVLLLMSGEFRRCWIHRSLREKTANSVSPPLALPMKCVCVL